MNKIRNVIGFLGTENYEIILYLARILDKLNRKVLILDYSFEQDLISCIPIPSGLDVSNEVITYFGINFTKTNLNEDLIQNYDDILINFGFNFKGEAIHYCTRVIYSTNQQKHNLLKLETIPDYDLPKTLLIKDMVKSKISKDYILDNINKNISNENIFLFDQDIIDSKYKLLVQYDTLFEFKRITNEVKNFLKQMIRDLVPDTTEKELNTAYKLAERGR